MILLLDSQIDLLYERGLANGATVEIWDETQLKIKNGLMNFYN